MRSDRHNQIVGLVCYVCVCGVCVGGASGALSTAEKKRIYSRAYHSTVKQAKYDGDDEAPPYYGEVI